MTDNGYEPAFPLHHKIKNRESDEVTVREHIALGLTKREYIAVKLLSSVLSNNASHYFASVSEGVTSVVIELTDKLLKQLEETKK